MLLILGLLGVVAILFAAAVVATQEGEVLRDAPPDGPDVRLPPGRVVAEDLRSVRFSMVLRGYRMSQVDEVLERLGQELADRDTRLADLERALAELVEPAVAQAEAEQSADQPLEAAAEPVPSPAPAMAQAPVERVREPRSAGEPALDLATSFAMGRPATEVVLPDRGQGVGDKAPPDDEPVHTAEGRLGVPATGAEPVGSGDALLDPGGRGPEPEAEGAAAARSGDEPAQTARAEAVPAAEGVPAPSGDALLERDRHGVEDDPGPAPVVSPPRAAGEVDAGEEDEPVATGDDLLEQEGPGPVEPAAPAEAASTAPASPAVPDWWPTSRPQPEPEPEPAPLPGRAPEPEPEPLAGPEPGPGTAPAAPLGPLPTANAPAPGVPAPDGVEDELDFPEIPAAEAADGPEDPRR